MIQRLALALAAFCILHANTAFAGPISLINKLDTKDGTGFQNVAIDSNAIQASGGGVGYSTLHGNNPFGDTNLIIDFSLQAQSHWPAIDFLIHRL